MPEQMLPILLVEDNPGDARLIQEFLRETTEERYAVTCVRTLAEGVGAAAETEFVAVLLDLALPDSAGLETFRTFIAHNDEVPIILLTGNDDESLASSAVAEGAQDYLPKTDLNARLISRSVRYAIQRFRLRKELIELQERVVESERDRVLLQTAAAAAHEINQPLSAVVGLSDLLLGRDELDDDLRDVLKDILEAGNRIGDIVKRMRATEVYETQTYLKNIDIVRFGATASREQQTDD